jgi:hypothetical protein
MPACSRPHDIRAVRKRQLVSSLFSSSRTHSLAPSPLPYTLQLQAELAAIRRLRTSWQAAQVPQLARMQDRPGFVKNLHFFCIVIGAFPLLDFVLSAWGPPNLCSPKSRQPGIAGSIETRSTCIICVETYVSRCELLGCILIRLREWRCRQGCSSCDRARRMPKIQRTLSGLLWRRLTVLLRGVSNMQSSAFLLYAMCRSDQIRVVVMSLSLLIGILSSSLMTTKFVK